MPNLRTDFAHIQGLLAKEKAFKGFPRLQRDLLSMLSWGLSPHCSGDFLWTFLSHRLALLEVSATNGNYRAKTSLTNFPGYFPRLFLSHFEPKTSHNAMFWGPNTLAFWGHRAPTIWANKEEVFQWTSESYWPHFCQPPSRGTFKQCWVIGTPKGGYNNGAVDKGKHKSERRQMLTTWC